MMFDSSKFVIDCTEAWADISGEPTRLSQAFTNYMTTPRTKEGDIPDDYPKLFLGDNQFYMDKWYAAKAPTDLPTAGYILGYELRYDTERTLNVEWDTLIKATIDQILPYTYGYEKRFPNVKLLSELLDPMIESTPKVKDDYSDSYTFPVRYDPENGFTYTDIPIFAPKKFCEIMNMCYGLEPYIIYTGGDPIVHEEDYDLAQVGMPRGLVYKGYVVWGCIPHNFDSLVANESPIENLVSYSPANVIERLLGEDFVTDYYDTKYATHFLLGIQVSFNGTYYSWDGKRWYADYPNPAYVQYKDSMYWYDPTIEVVIEDNAYYTLAHSIHDQFKVTSPIYFKDWVTDEMFEYVNYEWAKMSRVLSPLFYTYCRAKYGVLNDINIEMDNAEAVKFFLSLDALRAKQDKARSAKKDELIAKTPYHIMEFTNIVEGRAWDHYTCGNNTTSDFSVCGCSFDGYRWCPDTSPKVTTVGKFSYNPGKVTITTPMVQAYLDLTADFDDPATKDSYILGVCS